MTDSVQEVLLWGFIYYFFNTISTSDKLVPLRLFVEKGCLSYLLIALSSHDIKCRRLAYHALNDFHDHAEGSRWQERLEVNYVLDLINGSRDQDAQKLPYVIALFFARVVKILLYPGLSMSSFFYISLLYNFVIHQYLYLTIFVSTNISLGLEVFIVFLIIWQYIKYNFLLQLTHFMFLYSNFLLPNLKLTYGTFQNFTSCFLVHIFRYCFWFYNFNEKNK